jgi:hypothetical protein
MASESSALLAMEELRELELERIREQQERVLKAREAERHAQQAENEELRRARTSEDEPRGPARAAPSPAAANPDARPEPACVEAEATSLRPGFPTGMVLAAALLLVAVALVAILLQLQSRVDRAAQRQAAISTQLEAQHRAFEMAHAAVWARIEARIGALEEQLESARPVRTASAEPPVVAAKPTRERARPAEAHAPAPAAAAPAPNTTPGPKIGNTTDDPLGGLTEDVQWPR